MAHAEGSSDLAKSVSLYRNIASSSLACCGAFYICAGARAERRSPSRMFPVDGSPNSSFVSLGQAARLLLNGRSPPAPHSNKK